MMPMNTAMVRLISTQTVAMRRLRVSSRSSRMAMKRSRTWRHAEVAQTPGEAGQDGHYAVPGALAELRHTVDYLLYAVGVGDRSSHAEEFQEAGYLLCVGYYIVYAAGAYAAYGDDDNKRDYHDDRLHEIGGALSQEAANQRVQQHEESSYYHHRHIVEAEECGKELAAGDKAARGIDSKEDEYEQRRYGHYDLAALVEAV